MATRPFCPRRADSGMTAYQLRRTAETTRARDGPKSIPCVSERIRGPSVEKLGLKFWNCPDESPPPPPAPEARPGAAAAADCRISSPGEERGRRKEEISLPAAGAGTSR